MNKRIIKLSGIRNLRTFAGLKTGDGRVIRENVLFRSAALHKITDKSYGILRDRYCLKRVIDLRTNDEVKKAPDRRLEGVDYLYMPVCPDVIPGISRELEPGKDSALDSLPDLTVVYRAVISGDEYVENISGILKTIINERDGATLWHCTAGKDRCGFVSVFILYMLGVDMETIKADYLLTNKDSMRESVKFYLLVRIFKRNKELARRVYDVYRAELGYLDAALEVIAKYGGMDKFIKERLGIDDRSIEDFRNRVLE